MIVDPLRGIFEDDHLEKNPNSLRLKMKCLWCGFIGPDAHTTRMIVHLLKQPEMHVKSFLEKIDEDAKILPGPLW